ncbi:MAG: radical SAM/Cys-rich domain protein [Clostridiales bacterium]|jgi:radical SAM/Cys-rich protein|nr:radical SAM/Cys-rich domain protein [Clostridiales bacterium]
MTMEENRAVLLDAFKAVPDFEENMVNNEAKFSAKDLMILQINLGKMCNQKCKHCHVMAGPDRKEVMSKETMAACLKVYENNSFDTIDITGGAPEMNPNFEWFIEEASKICNHVIVRTNLTILAEPQYEHLMQKYADEQIELFASLPYYSKKDTDRQRGESVFDGSVEILKKLNRLGYGDDDKLVLNLVYNPGGAFLPPAQTSLEKEYRQKLMSDFGIKFTNLYAITNNPVGRFGEFLLRSENFDSYMETLCQAYNPSAEMTMMCRNQLSVGYDGRLYDCDFNQSIDLPVVNNKTIFDYAKGEPIEKRCIAFNSHCYACTAGQGSSCGGATA